MTEYKTHNSRIHIKTFHATIFVYAQKKKRKYYYKPTSIGSNLKQRFFYFLVEMTGGNPVQAR